MQLLTRARRDDGGTPVRRAGRLRRLGAAVATTAIAASGLIALSAPAASAATQTTSNATFEWGLNAEVQGSTQAGGCHYFSTGESAGTQATYATTTGNVSVIKNGSAPVWGTKCDGATTGTVNQKVVWSGGTGTVDPTTGAATLSFTGKFWVNFYNGLVPFFIKDPVVNVDGNGDGAIVATMGGYASDQNDPFVKIPIGDVANVTVADLTNAASDTTTGFTITPDYAGVTFDAPVGGDAQNRTIDGWGAWPTSYVNFQFVTGTKSYWYSNGSPSDAKKAPSAITVGYGTLSGGEDPEDPPAPGTGEQVISATVPDEVDPGEFIWTIVTAERNVTLTNAEDKGTYLQSTGAIKPITVTDSRVGGPTWSIAGQVGDFTNGLSGKYLGWTPNLSAAGSGATPGGQVLSGITSGNGLKDTSVLASASSGHVVAGTATLGADLDLRIPKDTAAGTYSATLTITALS